MRGGSQSSLKDQVKLVGRAPLERRMQGLGGICLIPLDQEGQGRRSWPGSEWQRTMGLSGWLEVRALVPRDQDPKGRGSDSEAGSGRKWSHGQKKWTKDLRSSSRGEGWHGG